MIPPNCPKCSKRIDYSKIKNHQAFGLWCPECGASLESEDMPEVLDAERAQKYADLQAQPLQERDTDYY